MTSITIAPAPLKLAKRAIQAQVPGIKSAHLSEAIAAGLGYKSHAALKASMLDDDPVIRLLSQTALEERAGILQGRGIGLNKEWFENELCQAGDGIFRTMHPDDIDLEDHEGYRMEDPAAYGAWQNLAIAGVNAMIRERVFTIRPGDDRWDWRHAPSLPGDRHFPTFTMQAEWEGIPLLVCATFTHHYEVNLRVIAWPTEAAFDPALHQILYLEKDEAARAGKMCIQVCLERQRGAWLQSGSYRNIHGFQKLMAEIAVLQQEWPLGYAPQGIILF